MDNTEKPDKLTSANFREVCIGAIAPKWLYRSSDPVTHGGHDFQDFIMAELAETAKIATVLNLADNERELKRKAGLIPWYDKLYQAGCIIALDMKFDFLEYRFGSKINTDIKFMFDHKGPYLIHCAQGIDRTGFFVMLLEMLMDARKDEITADYMASFLDKPGFERKSVYYKREYSNFVKVLRELNGGKPVTTKGLPGMAEKYIFENVGLIQSELDQLRLALSKKQEQGYGGQNVVL
jgi:protein tyrosine/serine phosphatase